MSCFCSLNSCDSMWPKLPLTHDWRSLSAMEILSLVFHKQWNWNHCCNFVFLVDIDCSVNTWTAVTARGRDCVGRQMDGVFQLHPDTLLDNASSKTSWVTHQLWLHSCACWVCSMNSCEAGTVLADTPTDRYKCPSLSLPPVSPYYYRNYVTMFTPISLSVSFHPPDMRLLVVLVVLHCAYKLPSLSASHISLLF